MIDIPELPDRRRMFHERNARLRAAMAEAGVDVLVLLVGGNVSYATGASWPLSDAGRANIERPVAVVVADDQTPHLFARLPEEEMAGLQLDADHVHDPVYLEFDEGVERFVKILADLAPVNATLALDDLTGAMHRARGELLREWPPRAASDVLGAARLVKTPDELATIRHALWINEQAMAEVQARLAPGIRQTDLTGLFVRRVFELGALANGLDPIWQVMPPRRSELPWTVHGDIPCPLLSTERELAAGDVLWVDTGIVYGGYHSDFGRTWVVGQEPTARQQEQYHRWQEISDAAASVLRAGVTGAELTAAAMAGCDGQRPWMPHFYLGHGLGVDAAEMPFVGTDLGADFDAQLVLPEGTILVIEPIVWDEGHSGYRSENVFVVTEDGYINLSDYPYDPYGETGALHGD